MKLKHLRSGVANTVPTSEQLDIGQIAMNYADGRLFIQNSEGEVVVVSSSEAVVRALASIKDVNGNLPDSAGSITLGAEDIGDHGVAPLDVDSKIPTSYLPASILGAVTYIDTWNAETNTPELPDPTTVKGNYYIVSTPGTQFGIDFTLHDWVISNGVEWDKVDSQESVVSVAGKTGVVVLSASDISSGIFDADRLGLDVGSTKMLTTNSEGKTTWIDIPVAYTLPTASATTLGGVRIGEGLNISAEGVLSVAEGEAAMVLAGTWDASSNTPDLSDPSGFTHGTIYRVSTGGDTDLSGVSVWNQGDLVMAVGTGPGTAATTWAKIPSAVVNDGYIHPTNLGAGAGNSKTLTTDASGNPTWTDSSESGVTSVGMTVPAPFQVSGSPITDSGTLAVTVADQAANTFYAGPGSGADAGPAFRALTIDDLPDIDEGTF